MNSEVLERMKGKENKGYYIAIALDGEVVGSYTERDLAETEARENGLPLLLATDKAFQLATRLGNITESREFRILPGKGEKAHLILREEARMLGYPEEDSVRDSLESRISAFSKDWSFYQGIRKEELAETLPNSLDRYMLFYMKKASPSWRIHRFSPESAMLIANARLEEEGQEGKSAWNDIDKSLFMCSADSTRPMFGNVTEIAIAPYDNEGEQEGKVIMTTMMAPNMRMALSFPLGKGNTPLDREGNPMLSQNQESGAPSKMEKVSMEYARLAMRFASAFLMLLECEKSPIEVVDIDKARKEKLERKGLKTKSPVSRYSVSLTKRYRSIIREPYGDTGESGRDYKEGKALSVVSVSGFIRNQAYGPGRSLRKRIWVDGFMRGQWIRNGVTYVTVEE